MVDGNQLNQTQIDKVVTRIQANADAAIIMHRADESSDEVVETLQAQGWQLEDKVDYVAGKRIRYMTRPEDTNED